MQSKELKESNVQVKNNTTELNVVKKEIKHFKAGENFVDDSYGYTWSEVVKNYLKTGYKVEEKKQEVFVLGKTYKVLKRDTVTAFYDENGNALFDVENQRLEREYDWLSSREEQKAELDANEETENVLQKSNKAEEQSEQVEDDIKAEGLVDNSVVVESNEEKYVGVDGAISKLQKELKTAEPKDFAKPIMEYLIGRCKESESLAEDICQIHKTWKKCYEFIVEKAKKKLGGKSGPVRSDVVFEWAEDYYHKNDKVAEEEKKTKKVTEKKTKDVEKKKEKAEKSNVSKENKAKEEYDTTLKSGIDNHKFSKEEIEERDTKVEKEIQKPKQQPKKNNKDMDGQLDFFSMLGI